MPITTEGVNTWKVYDELMMTYGFYLKHGPSVSNLALDDCHIYEIPSSVRTGTSSKVLEPWNLIR